MGRVPDESGGYRGQLAVLVKPNGVLGAAYLTAIKPFRRLFVNPRSCTASSATGAHTCRTQRRTFRRESDVL
ncbi:DUF2867 domain-containing protein [Micromonospora andamanensis]|uniref:DUF2867 domain-containing protein n=1 Tax=Micromonospora andamanensis TaxID=1287068 RepID=UPI00194F6861|nr:DUF2867 domain-containing protein [Micromonospora andamanensis]